MAGKHSDRDWQVGKSLAECTGYMFENQVACDVIFIVFSADGVPITIRAHKFMLISRSPVFETMLSGKYRETEEDIVINDIEPDIFKEMIRYMYTDKTSLTPHNVLYVMSAAKKYIIDTLVNKCAEFLENNIDVENVCTIFTHSFLLDEHELIEKCLKFMASNSEPLLKTTGFLGMSQASLRKFLGCDSMTIDGELVLFDACLRWAEHKCEQKGDVSGEELRAALGDCFFQLRIACIDFERLYSNCRLLEMLTDREFRLFSLCSYEGNADISPMFNPKDKLEKMGFNIVPRKNIGVYTASRITIVDINRTWVQHDGKSDEIAFGVDRAIQIIGVSLFCGKEKGDVHTCDVCVYDGVYGEWGATTSTTITSNGLDHQQTIMLEEPMDLLPDTGHTVQVTLAGPGVFYGDNGQEEVTVGGVTFNFAEDKDCTNGTDVEKGQIPGIIFRLIP